MAKRKGNPDIKSYLPPVSPVAIQPGDTGFKMIGNAYNRWLGFFKEKKAKIIDPDTTWDMNKKPISVSKMKSKYKTLHLKEDFDSISAKNRKSPIHIEDITINELDSKEKDKLKHKGAPSDNSIIIEETDRTNKVRGKSKPRSTKIYPFLDVDAKQKERGKKNLENLKDYRDWLNEDKKYIPRSEYKEETRKHLNLDLIRKTAEYEQLLKLGFKENTSYQQELNNTMRFERSRERQKEVGHDKVFYTIHPTGIVRRYNPEKGEEIPSGSGNIIKKFHSPFKHPKDYKKGLLYLWQYLRRKENRGDFR